MTVLDTTIRTRLHSALADYPLLQPIVETIDQQKGRAFLVGGAVRDLLLDLTIKDLDIEVHGVSLDALEMILRAFGPVNLVGKVYGVLRLARLDIDWSVPRTDSSGRKPRVIIDAAMSIKQACARRDLTMNAMGIDLVTHELIDPFNGYADLKNGVLRATDASLFIEDPLRFYRVMQFIGRFEFKPDATLNTICTTMSLEHISRERVEAEFEKLLLRSVRPSLGLRWLATIGRLHELLPELAATQGIQQDSRWHPEGDVYEHTLQAVDAAARQQHAQQEKLIIMYAALCHDLGKVSTTQHVDNRITSFGHDKAGVPLTRQLLSRITVKKEIIRVVQRLVRYHLLPVQFIKNGAKPPAYKRLARKLSPLTTLRVLSWVSLADCQGRNGQDNVPLTGAVPEVEAFIQKAEHIHVFEQPEEPVLKGRDLLDVVPPGKQMGKLLKKAYELQIAHGITDKEELKRRILR